LDAVLRGAMTPEKAQTLLTIQGIPWVEKASQSYGSGVSAINQLAKLWSQVYRSKMLIPSPDESLRLLNRNAINTPTLDRMLRFNGMIDDDVQSVYKNLRFDIPGPSDLVRFSVRHVFEPDLIARFGFNDEFNEILDIWHHAHGQQYDIFTGPFKNLVNNVGREFGTTADELAQRYRTQGLPEPSWARAYWWSHWVWPSPTQSYMFLQQLRPGRHAQRFPEETEHPQFTATDLNFLLRGNDYPPQFRKYLRAISYRVPGLRQIRQLRTQDVIDDVEEREMWKDLGYNPRDAAKLEAMDAKMVKDSR